MIPRLENKNSILIAPLNWGLGHASRSIVLIHHFLRQGKKVSVASDGLALEWLQKELKNEDIDLFELPGYDIDYNSSNMSWNMIRQYPKIKRAIKLESLMTQKIVEHWSPDLIISDNRYGVCHPDVESIMLSHQLSMSYENKVTATAFELQIKQWTQGFNKFWVPDHEDQKLTGKMSSSTSDIPIQFIGPLSRFSKAPQTGSGILVILSGPEPQRSKLEQSLADQLIKSDEELCFVRGSNLEGLPKLDEKFKVIDLAGTSKLEKLIHQSRLVITRAGYSSIMDFDVLEKPVIMIPTPGQKEQEYLMEIHEKNPLIRFVKQGEDVLQYLQSDFPS